HRESRSDNASLAGSTSITSTYSHIGYWTSLKLLPCHGTLTTVAFMVAVRKSVDALGSNAYTRRRRNAGGDSGFILNSAHRGKLRRQTNLHAEVGYPLCGNVGTQGGVTDGESAVHETILKVAGHSLEPGRNLGERDRVSGRALQRIVWKLTVNEGGADTPIGTVVIPAFIGIDEVTLAKTPD